MNANSGVYEMLTSYINELKTQNWKWCWKNV